MSDEATIECKPDGPLRVRNVADLTDWRGERIDSEPVMVLCRCGGSARKPFCDGTHRHNDFSGAKAAERTADRLDRYPAGRITVHDNRSICAHAGHCTDGLASVFKMNAEPWIDAAGAAAEQVVETIRRCPSGALSGTLDGRDIDDPSGGPAITVTRDGPYAVVGVRLLDQSWAQGASTQRYTLCRCGASNNKPFCDGSHWRVGFKDEGR